jgi:hypothetical protein
MIAHFVILERIKCGNQGKEREHRDGKKRMGCGRHIGAPP